MTSSLQLFKILYYIKQIDSMLPCVCSVIDHRGRQNVVRTSVTHSAAPRVPLFLLSVIYYWTDARQLGIYLLIRQRWRLMTKWRTRCDKKNKQKQFTLSYNKFHLREPQFSSSLLSPQSFSWSHFSSAPIQIPLAHVKSLELQVWETVAKKKTKKKRSSWSDLLHDLASKGVFIRR